MANNLSTRSPIHFWLLVISRRVKSAASSPPQHYWVLYTACLNTFVRTQRSNTLVYGNKVFMFLKIQKMFFSFFCYSMQNFAHKYVTWNDVNVQYIQYDDWCFYVNGRCLVMFLMFDIQRCLLVPCGMGQIYINFEYTNWKYVSLFIGSWPFFFKVCDHF